MLGVARKNRAFGVDSRSTNAGLFAFERSGGEAGDDYALVVLNTNGRQTSRVQLTTSRPAGSMLVDAMTPGVTLTVKAGGLLDVEVPAQGALVLVKP